MFKKVKKRNNQKVELDHTTDESTTVKAVEQPEIQDVEMAQPAKTDELDAISNEPKPVVQESIFARRKRLGKRKGLDCSVPTAEKQTVDA